MEESTSSNPSEIPDPVDPPHRDETQGLRIALNISMLGMLGFSIAVSVFIWRQIDLVRGQLSRTQPQFEALQKNYDSNTLPQLKSLFSQLDIYAGTNSEFRPFLEQYKEALK